MKFIFGGKGRSRGVRRTDKTERQPRLMEGQDGYTFRRSRTITGSLSNKVTSSRAERPDLKSERIRLHELHQHRRALKTGLLTMALLSLVLAFLLANSVAVTQKRFVAAGAIPESDQALLQSTINDYINRHPIEAFLVTLDEQRLAQFLQVSHPEVDSLKITDKWLAGSGEISVVFREPIIVWRINESKFYVDENGTAFTKSYGKEPALRVEDASGFTPEVAKEGSVASRRFIGYLGQLLGAVRSQHIGKVERVVIPASTRQLDIYFKKRGYPIKTHIDRDPYAQAEDIKNTLRFLDKRHISPGYVDVRVEGKAFYR